MRRVPFNEITAALHPPFTAVHSVMQHWGPPGAAFQPPTGILVNVAKLRARRDTEADGEREREKQRGGPCHSLTRPSQSFPPR